MLSQRPPLSPCAGSAQWRYRTATQKPLPFCSAHRTASVAQNVSHDPDVLSGANDNTSASSVYTSEFEGSRVMEASEFRLPVNNGAVEAHSMLLPQDESSLILHQQDFLGQCYSLATVSAMARLMGHHDDQEQLLAAGQASIVVLPKAQLLNVLKAGSGTPLDEASAALALLCEAGQYDAVLQYGNPLLKAASAALPFSPLGVGKQPVPHLEHLASDLALSIALAHISLAGGAGFSSSSAGSGGGVLMAPGGGGAGGAIGGLDGLEEVHGHLEAALQVLERHAVAAPLQQEVAYCLQGVAAAYAEEVLRSTPPVSSPPAAASGSVSGASGQHAVNSKGGAMSAAATPSASGAAAGGGSSNGNGVSGSSATVAAAHRAKAVSMLRNVLWRGSQQSPQVPQQQLRQQQQDSPAPQAVASTASSGGAGLEASATAAAAGGSGAAVWVPALTPEERSELMSPLRGLLAASEHIALYGPVASGQKPYGVVQLSDQELYDLAIAHLAQGVSTGWPHHVLQALSYFERVAQQQQGAGGGSRPPGGGGAGGGAAAAADVSFERSVCEALLGRRSTASGPAADHSSAAAATPAAPAAAAAAASGATAPSNGAGASAPAGPASSLPSMSVSVIPSGTSGEEWDEGEEVALLRRLEAQLLKAAAAAGMGADASGSTSLEGVADAAVSFSVNERGDGVGSEYEDDGAESAAQMPSGPSAIGPEVLISPLLPGASAGTRAADGASAAAVAPQQHQQQQQHSQQPSHSPSTGKSRSKSERYDDDVARKYGWAESWLELSVMPCFPETAGAGPVSLARWFADPRVILFNKLLAVRSGEVQVTAALGSAVAHVSYASRQRLWQLWQAAAHAVSSARGHSLQQQQPQQPAAAVTAAQGSNKAPAAAAATDGGAAAAGGVAETAKGAAGGPVAPLASGLLAQSRAALQDMAPRAAAAASSAVAAAAAAVSSAAASSPRAVAAAAAGWMVPFGLSRWGASGERPAATATAAHVTASASPAPVGGRTVLSATALPRTATAVDEKAVGVTGSPDVQVGPQSPTVAGTRQQRQLQYGTDGGAAGGSDAVGRGARRQAPLPQPLGPDGPQQPVLGSPSTNNVVPFPAGAATGAGAAAAVAPTPLLTPASAASPLAPVAVPAAPPVADGLVDVALASPPASGGGSDAAAAAAADGVDAAAGGALWAPDAEGHLRPRPRMVARAVQRAKAAAASFKDRVGALPVSPKDWAAAVMDPALADEATSREAVRRVAAVAAQAMCLGALAAYVGSRIVSSGALQAAAASGYATAAAAAAPTMDASTAQVTAAARAVARWLGGTGVGASQQEAVGQWPLLRGTVRQTDSLPEVTSAEAVGQLVNQYGKHAQLDETAAAALLRGWAAARAAAPALSDPRDRGDLLSGLLGGRALKGARAEADRNARMGRRVHLQRIKVEVEQMRCRTAAAAGSAAAAAEQGLAEVTVTAVVVTAGTETSRAAPLPLSYCSRERLSLTFRRAPADGPGPQAAQGPVWRLVDIRDAPPALY